MCLFEFSDLMLLQFDINVMYWKPITETSHISILPRILFEEN